MTQLEIANGEVIVGVPTCRMVGSVAPIPDGVWIGLGYPNEQGLLIDNDEWDNFVELVKAIDKVVLEMTNG